jgi:hypothetical protein
MSLRPLFRPLRGRSVQISCVVLLGGIALSAFASRPETGIMAAEWTPPAGSGASPQTVTIPWESRTPAKGTMRFILGPGGERFIGTYVLVEKTSVEAEVGPMYQAWQSFGVQEGAVAGSGWFVSGWTVDAYVQHYDGHVLAQLEGDRGHTARCRLDLGDTNAGIPGGGTGECQVSDGGSLKVRF